MVSINFWYFVLFLKFIASLVKSAVGVYYKTQLNQKTNNTKRYFFLFRRTEQHCTVVDTLISSCCCSLQKVAITVITETEWAFKYLNVCKIVCWKFSRYSWYCNESPPSRDQRKLFMVGGEGKWRENLDYSRTCLIIPGARICD